MPSLHSTMTRNFIIKISVITTLFRLNNADDYEFHDITTLDNDIRKSIRSDLYDVNQIDNMPISNLKYLLIIVRKDKKEELDGTEDLAEALRTGAGHLDHGQIAAHKEKVKKDYIQLLAAERVKSANVRRVQEVQAFMKFNYKATEYLYSEVMRIKRDRKIYDGPRQIIFEVESSHNKTLIRAMQKCIVRSMDIHGVDEWEGTPNKITIHTVADPINDGVD